MFREFGLMTRSHAVRANRCAPGPAAGRRHYSARSRCAKSAGDTFVREPSGCLDHSVTIRSASSCPILGFAYPFPRGYSTFAEGLPHCHYIWSPHISRISMASRQPCAVLLVDTPGTSSIGLRTSGPLRLVVANFGRRRPLQAFLANAGFLVCMYA